MPTQGKIPVAIVMTKIFDGAQWRAHPSGARSGCRLIFWALPGFSAALRWAGSLWPCGLISN